MNYYKFNQLVIPIVAALSDKVSLLKQVNITPGTQCAGIGLANDFFSTPIFKDYQKPFVFIWQEQQYIFKVLPQGYVKSTGLCCNMVCKYFEHLDTQANITLGYYIDDMLIGSGKREVVSTLDELE